MMHARDIMTAHPSVVTPADSTQRAVEIMNNRKVAMLPVIDDLSGRHVLGIVTDGDVQKRCDVPAHGAGCLVRDHMTSLARVDVTPEMELEEVERAMQAAGVRRVLVVRDGSRLVGVISRGDIASRAKPAARQETRATHDVSQK